MRSTNHRSAHPAVTFVVMAGGRGERLWPLVRTAVPKACLAPDGTQTLLGATIARLRAVRPDAEWLIVTTAEQAPAVRARVPAALRRAVVVEPAVKNTAACLTLAAAIVARRAPHRVLVAAPADHWIGEPAAFRRALRTAILVAARRRAIVTIGIRPTSPQTGLGYLCAGSRVRGPWMEPVFCLRRFVEKPSRQVAQRLLERPATYWNSGLFVSRADRVLEAVTEWLPAHAQRLVPAVTAWLARRPGTAHTGVFSARLRPAYRRLAPVSFDQGVMRHLDGALVVEGRFPWVDLGSWDAWAQVGRAAARTISVDSENVTVVGQPHHLIATVGVRDLLVVQTPSATLICRPNQSQAVRELVRRVGADPRLAAYR